MPENEITITECRKVFNERYPYGDVEGLAYEQLPYRIRREIKNAPDCGLSFAVIHQDGSRTYIAHDLSQDALLIQDRNKSNVYNGEGSVYFDSQDNIPIVGFTYTSKRFGRRGLGTRRLVVMDAAARAFFGDSLASSLVPTVAQRSIWERLVGKQQAETQSFPGSGFKRYKFIK